MIDEVVAEMTAAGAPPPVSLTDRQYSGNLRVRTSPALHSRLAVEAVEQGVSLNQWVVQKLADRKTIPSLDDLFYAENQWTADCPVPAHLIVSTPYDVD